MYLLALLINLMPSCGVKIQISFKKRQITDPKLLNSHLTVVYTAGKGFSELIQSDILKDIPVSHFELLT